ncbi:hypothetical protein [Streptomyces sp. NBC_01497]|uniref:hypothetical protein n=1 Tax=Streptomyces sp. NBC_01497 TaxID=2903885 RepID=UPI002E343BF7|nr:hypothetical protein [Streptomyces sp. NBC_01497]
MQKPKTRRTAGTATFLDVLLRWTWIRRRTTEKDIADLEQGWSLEMVAHSRTVGLPKTVRVGKGKQINALKIGRLALSPDGGMVWSAQRGGEAVPLTGPFALSEEPTGKSVLKFAVYELETGGGTFDVAITKVDVGLLRHACAVSV